MMITGKRISPQLAYRGGIADEIYPSAYIDSHLEGFLDQVTNHTKKHITEVRKRRKSNEALTLMPFYNTIFFGTLRKRVQSKTKGIYPAPLKILEVLKKTLYLSGKNATHGYDIERQAFVKLAKTAQSRNLINIFLNNQQLKKENWGNPLVGKSKPIENTLIVGAGMIGSGVAWLMGKSNITTRLSDTNQKALERAFRQISNFDRHDILYGGESQLESLRKKGLFSYKKISTKKSEMETAKKPHIDVAIEAVDENEGTKKTIYRDLEKEIDKNAVILTSTSSLSISRLASHLKFPDRFLGMHLFSPVNQMSLVEIIPGKKSSKGAVAKAIDLSRRLGKVTVVVKDKPGFLVNRILFPYLNEAALLIEGGMTPRSIDHVFEKFGMLVGPITLLDEMGLDVALEIASVLEKEYGNRLKICSILKKMTHEKKLLGKKQGNGFYIYRKNKKEQNPMVFSLQKNKEATKIDSTHILLRPIMLMICEALYSLKERITSNAKHIDLAIVYGAGFPPCYGGALKHAEKIGLQKTTEILQDLASRFGSRFNPPPILSELKKAQKSVYEY